MMASLTSSCIKGYVHVMYNVGSIMIEMIEASQVIWCSFSSGDTMLLLPKHLHFVSGNKAIV